MIEALESRIAPAALGIVNVKAAVIGTPLTLNAGDMLSTSEIGGSYLLFVEKGTAVVYTTDLNNNDQIDFNEITGISAGDGLRMISFVDIHGDVVTNLRANGTLTDSDNNASNGLDGRAVLDSRIEKIEMRSLTQEDLPNGNVLDRLAFTTFSIHGNIYAGGGFGVAGGGLTINVAGNELLEVKFDGSGGITQFTEGVTPSIGSIKVGTAVSGQLFSFGTSAAGEGLGFNGEDVQGTLVAFREGSGQAGADIIGLRMADGITKFNLGTLQAGNGGFGGRGGNVDGIALTGDTAGGYRLIAGNAGDGDVGAVGGSILNFSDKGSITSEVVLQSGNGGLGLLGAGGAGGSIDLTNITPNQIAGRLIVNLGHGGDGQTAGGNGGSQTNGSIIAPEGGVPVGVNVVSSMHQPGDIYNTMQGSFDIRGFDFDNDGFNDLVYTSTDTSGTGNQLVVLFHDGTSFDPLGQRYPGALGTLYLNGPAEAEAVTVGDFNGDGFLDIAAASTGATTAGVSVFLAQTATDPSSGETRFAGFHDPIYSALPAVPDLLGPNDVFYQKPFGITSMVAGDFNDDGVLDLAINTIQSLRGQVAADRNVVMVLTGDANAVSAPNGTGYFYADFNSGIPFQILPGFEDNELPVVLKATALTNGGRDVFFASTAGVDGIPGRSITLYDYASGSLSATEISLGQVDTNRDLGQISLSFVTVEDFTILDADNDGDADIVVLASTPESYLITLQGNGAGAFTIATGNGTDNSGVSLGVEPGGLGLEAALVGILTTDADGDGRADDVMLVGYSGEPAVEFYDLSFPPSLATVTLEGTTILLLTGPAVETFRAFDTYRPIEAATTNVGPAIALPSVDPLDTRIVAFGTASAESIANNGFFFTAGDGGDSAIGKGGAGGQIGSKLVTSGGETRGTLSIVVPDNDAFAPIVRLIAGNGGDGYTGGGAGGAVRGVSVTQAGVDPNDTDFNVQSFLFAGHGGDAVKGVGGAGGGLDSLAILGGQVFVGGNGGRGLTGGAGGDVLGNKVAGLNDAVNASTISLAVRAGDGGLGLKAGGAGGSIRNFTPEFRAVEGGEGNTLLYYRGGDGGNSLSGAGGAGGSVTNSSPVQNDNNLVADIYIEGGRGGDGLSGGRGGSVSDFVNSPGQGSLPLSVTVLGGYGGIGTARNGGAGGDISKVNISARGIGSIWTLDFSNPQNVDAFPGVVTGISTFGRYIAGEGAISYGATGGAGGSLSSVTGTAASGGFAIASGKGGDGLIAGAAGGSIGTAVINAAGTSEGKVLVISGDGGDVYSSLATADDPLAYGGVNGNGGNGGNISNFTQASGEKTIVDLISGNGGSTVNFGNSLDLTTKVGRGGSISNVNVRGDIGDVRPDRAIFGYVNTLAGDLMSDFVRDTLLAAPASSLSSLGNVGIITGAAGRVEDNDNDGELDPASVGINGSLSNVVAENIMSAISGSVDRIASIQSIIDVRVRVESSIYGADKSVPAPAGGNTREYLNSDGEVIPTPELGGRLLDGAIIGKNDRVLKTIRDFIRR